MKSLAVICVRAGSKGVPNKNLRLLLGKPLVQYTIEQAQQSGVFDKIAVSSDSREILKLADNCGVEHVIDRPAEMANDHAPKLPSIRHCVLEVEKTTGSAFDIIVDLDATAPLRAISDIRAALAMLIDSDADNLVTAKAARHSPYFNLVEGTDNGRVQISKTLENPIFRRQDAPKCYDLNASVFCWKRHFLFSDSDLVIGDNTILFEMPDERSVDIDSLVDLEFVEFLMRKNQRA